MDYEVAWKEMKNWLDEDISNMLERKKIVSGRAYHIIKSKLDGLKIAQKYMEDYEKKFKRSEVENG
jgi:hypothetical protein